MPSEPSKMNSVSLVRLYTSISGVATTTFGLPPYFGILAAQSPKVLDTESLPGNTLCGG